MAEQITPRVDIAFRKIFGVEENKDLLISLINSIVSQEDQVREVTLLNPYNLKSFREDKLSILDIKAKGHTGKRYNIEIQIMDEGDYDKRALYYWGKLYTEQLQQGVDYAQLNKAIGIHILNFTSIPDSNKYHHVFHLLEKDSHIHYFKDMELHTVELHKFEVKSSNQGDTQRDKDLLLSKVKTSLDAWVAFLTRHDLLMPEKLPSSLNAESLKKALDVLEVMNFTKEERELYEGQLNWLRIEYSTLKKAEDKAEARGRVAGRAEGAKERALAIARVLLKNQMSKDFIIETTGLSPEDLEMLGDKEPSI